MWIWLPCSYYSAWHDRWLVKHFPKALCRKISCLSRKTWMSFWGGCFFFFLPSSASHMWVERRELHSFILLVFHRNTDSPHTLLSLEAPYAIVSFYIILLFFSSSWWQPILTVRASSVRLQAVVCFLPQEWTQSVEGRWNRRRGPGKMEKKNPVWWGDD